MKSYLCLFFFPVKEGFVCVNFLFQFSVVLNIHLSSCIELQVENSAATHRYPFSLIEMCTCHVDLDLKFVSQIEWVIPTALIAKTKTPRRKIPMINQVSMCFFRHNCLCKLPKLHLYHFADDSTFASEGWNCLFLLMEHSNSFIFIFPLQILWPYAGNCFFHWVTSNTHTRNEK